MLTLVVYIILLTHQAAASHAFPMMLSLFHNTSTVEQLRPTSSGQVLILQTARRASFFARLFCLL